MPPVHVHKQVGDLERKYAMLSRKPEDEYWSEEAGRRYARAGCTRKAEVHKPMAGE
jgi:hypothetical protein